MSYPNNPTRLLLAPLTCACLEVFCGAALAQTVPGIGEAIKQGQPASPQTPPTRGADPAIITTPEADLALPAGQSLLVKDFRIEGATGLVPESELQGALEKYRGHPLDMAQITEAAGKVSAVLRAHGYLLARTYVPRQDASQGTLMLQVLPGKFGRVTVHNKSRLSDATIAGYFDALKDQSAITRQSLERSLLLIDDLPGAPLPKLTIAPGSSTGTSDFTVDAAQDDFINGYVLADNMGSRYTSKNRLSTALDINSPTGLGDRISLTAMDSEGGRLGNSRAAYSVPLGSDGWRAEVAASNTTYALGGDYGDLEATGNARTLEGTLSYPLQRTRDTNWWMNLNLAAKHLKDEIKVADMTTPKTSQVATLGMQREAWRSLFGLPDHLGVSVSASYGSLHINDADQLALNVAGANTIGHFGHLNLTAENTLNLSPKWAFTLNATAQKALLGHNLDSSEQINIAGPGGVKAYREVVSGDNGYLAGSELRYTLPGGALAHNVSAFAETGRVYLEDASYTTYNGTRISDCGLGYQARYRAFYLKAQVAHTMGPRPAQTEPAGKTRVLLQAGLVF